MIIYEESFKAAYHDGLQTHVRKLSVEISTLTAKQDSLRRELAAVEEQMNYLEKEVAQAGTGQARMMRCQNSKSKNVLYHYYYKEANTSSAFLKLICDRRFIYQ